MTSENTGMSRYLAIALMAVVVVVSVGGSVFLAFAYLFPDFELLLFFILPVKIKWLALITWIGYFLGFAFGSWHTRLIILASIANFLLFFGRDIMLRMRAGRRRMAYQVQKITREDEPFHQCSICGITDVTHPEAEFRYCTECRPTRCFCSDHLDGHEHVTEE